MKNISVFLALKYFRSRDRNFISFHSGMAIFGIAIGVLILILVTSVMNGFQRELKERILETIPHASILGDIRLNEFTSLEKTLYENSQVIGAAPYIETQGLLSSASYLKGVYFLVSAMLTYFNVVSAPFSWDHSFNSRKLCWILHRRKLHSNT